MAVTVKHNITAPLAGSDLIGATEWNADHTVTGLGTAAEADSADFATAAQGALADTALQPGAQIPWTDVTGKPTFATVATTGAYSDLDGAPDLSSVVTSARTITAGTGLTGGGDLSANRTIAADLATQGEAEAGTDNAKLMTPLRTNEAIAALFNVTGSAPKFACRAWVNFDGTGPTIRASGNVSSISRPSTGSFVVNFTTAMPDANYAITCEGSYSGSGAGSWENIESITTTSAGFSFANDISPGNPGTVVFAAFR
jgi:hypothetical protein